MSLPLNPLQPPSSTAPRLQQGLFLAILFVVLASLAFMGHAALVAALGAFGLVWLALLSVASMFVSIEFAYALMMVGLFLQNVFVATVSPLIKDSSDFAVLLASSVVNISLTAFLGLLAWLKWRGQVFAENRILLSCLFFFFICVVCYTVLGAAMSSLSSALVYARVYAIGPMMLVIGGALGLKLTLDYAFNVVRVLAIILVVWGIVEFFFTYNLYSFFNIRDFLNFKFANVDYADNYSNLTEIIESYKRSYLNLSGSFGLDFLILRPLGPNMHPISYSYALIFCCLICFINRFYVVSLACFLIATLVGAKGPLLIVLASIALCVLYERTRDRKRLIIALVSIMAIYTVAGLIYGIISEDYHVIGFIGGVKGFFSNPLGHGVGVGGSMSLLGMNVNEASLQEFQYNGAADFALESAIGVMLYQFGIASAVFFIFYWQLWKSVWKATMFFSSDPRLIVVPVVLALLLVNGIFQEEVFSPLGWGPWMLFCGLILGIRWQEMNGLVTQEDSGPGIQSKTACAKVL